MRKSNLLLAGLALAITLTFVPEVSAQSYVLRSNVSQVSVRMNPGGFIIGTLYSSAGIYRTQTSSNGYHYYGYCSGNYGGCGWVETTYIQPGGSTQAACFGGGFTGTGTASRIYLLDNYARNVNDYVANAATPLPLRDDGQFVRIKPGATTGFYGNYRGGQFKNAYSGTLTDAHAVYWRWISDDGQAVLCRFNLAPGYDFWGFIRRSSLPDKLPYSDGINR